MGGVNLHRILKAEWNEEDHPRDTAGRFISDLVDATTENPFNPRERVLLAMNAAVEVSRTSADTVHIHSVRSFAPGEKTGAGTAALNMLTALADKHSVTLEGIASKYGGKGISNTQLKAWYARHGFTVTRDEIRREPKVQEGPVSIKLSGRMRVIDIPQKSHCSCTLHKAQPVQTVVGKYVEAKQLKVSRKIVRVLAEYRKVMAKKVAGLYEKRTAQKLAKADDTDAIVQSILDQLELDDVAVDVVDSISPELIRAFKQAGVTGIAQVGFSATQSIVDHLDRAALEYAGSRGAELVRGLNDTTRESLRSTIADAVENGLSAESLSSRIEELDSVFGESRADTIARTELATAHVQGNVEGWRQTGMVTHKQWLLADTHPGEDECDDNAADGVIGIDEEFSSGVFAPPAHPSCLCDLLPIMEGED